MSNRNLLFKPVDELIKLDLDAGNLFADDPRRTFDESELRAWASKLSKQMRGVEFAYNPKSFNPKYYAYYPEDAFPLGYLEVHKVDADKYEYKVTSRVIENQRSKNSEPNTKMSTDIDVATRNACKYLKRFSLQEEADTRVVSLVSLAQKVASTYTAKDMNATDELSRVVNGRRSYGLGTDKKLTREEFTSEIKLLMQSYTFNNPQVAELFANYIDGFEASQIAYKKQSELYTYVRVLDDDRVIVVQDISVGNRISEYIESNSKVVAKLSQDQVPDYIKDAVASLYLLNDGEIVDGLGVRISERVYYVLQQ